MLSSKQFRALGALVLIVVAIGSARVLSSRGDIPFGLEGAETAFVRFQLPLARTEFEKIWNDPTQSSDDRTRAGMQLARIAGHIDGDMPAARQYVTAITQLEDDHADAWLLLSQLERRSGDFEAAMAAALQGEASSLSEFQRGEAAVAWAQAVLSHAIEADWDSNLPPPASNTIDDALQRILRVLAHRRGAIGATETALGLALLTGHGDRALQLWRDYYRLDQTAVTGVLREPASTLSRVLPGIVPERRSTKSQRDELVQSLTQSRLHRFAAMVAHAAPSAERSPNLIEAINYGEFLRAIAQICIMEYRRKAIGNGSESRFRARVDDATQELWVVLRRDDSQRSYTRQAARDLLAARFGALSKFEHSNGQFGLHYGHAVVDQQLTVSQYGQEATMRFLSLDSMVSNGYSSWYWEHAQVGGWVDRDIGRIVQIRRPYLGGDSAWVAITDPRERSETIDLIAKSWDKDDEIARQNPVSFLPGLAARIQYRARTEIRDELAESGMSGPALRQAFVRRIEEISYEYSILAHEGRHAIDSRTIANAIRPGAGKEFRAKLSEIAFSSHPFMALGGGILLRNIGDDTSHGQANERIMKGLVEWMEAHSAEIAGFVQSRPTLPQLDLLTNEQLVRAAQSMDPLAE